MGKTKNKVFAIINNKGGVGKTTTALNLGRALSLQKRKVLVIDFDPQESLSSFIPDDLKSTTHDISKVLSREKMEIPIVPITKNFHMVPTTWELENVITDLEKDVNGYFRLQEILSNIVDDYDFIIIDCRPSLDILTLNAMMAANSLIIIVNATALAVMAIPKVIEIKEQVSERLNPELNILGLLVTAYNGNTAIQKLKMEELKETYGDFVFKSVIRHRVVFQESAHTGQSVFDYDRKSDGSKDYAALAKEILKMH